MKNMSEEKNTQHFFLRKNKKISFVQNSFLKKYFRNSKIASGNFFGWLWTAQIRLRISKLDRIAKCKRTDLDQARIISEPDSGWEAFMLNTLMVFQFNPATWMGVAPPLPPWLWLATCWATTLLPSRRKLPQSQALWHLWYDCFGSVFSLPPHGFRWFVKGSIAIDPKSKGLTPAMYLVHPQCFSRLRRW